ncbi:nucleoside deaminase [candidate division WOR-3 bacterium]|nr:nucleoside deaminase [candidate division WOR-3 bacterium]
MTDEIYMKKALEEAEKASEEDEVPVGAVVVKDGVVIGRGHNRTESLLDASAHAEIIAMTAAAETLGNWRLEGCQLYSTVEPCIMCTGACLLFRISRIIYGAEDPKFGGCISQAKIPEIPTLNHKIEVIGGILATESAQLMKKFFSAKRNRQ